MKKKLLTIILSIFMMLVMMPTAIFAEGSQERLETSVASLKCGDIITYYDTIAEVFTSANSSNVDCEITILKECSHEGSLTLNNSNNKVITLNTGNEGTVFTIVANANSQSLVEVKSRVILKGNGGIITVNCNNKTSISGINVNGSSAQIDTYDGFILNIINGGTSTRGLVTINGAVGKLHGGKITCPKASENGVNKNLSTIVCWTDSSIDIYGGEYHWDVNGGTDYWAGVLDCATSNNKKLSIYGGYFDGPLWWSGSPLYNICGGKYTSQLKSNNAIKEGTDDWSDKLGAGKHSKEIKEKHNGIQYNYEVYDDNVKVININTGTTHNSIADGMSSLENGDTLQILQDISENVTVGLDKEFTLDLNGHVLKPSSENSIITVNGNLTVIDKAPDYTNNGYVDIYGLWHYDVEKDHSLQTGEITKSITGGIITGGAAENGGGVYVADNGAFTMTSGTILGNTATTSGGGIYATSNSNITLGGTAQISNNAVNIISNNVYLSSGNNIAVENPKNMIVGVTLENGIGRFTKNNNVSKDYVNYFYSDNSDYTVVINNTNDSDKYLELVNSTIKGSVKDNNNNPIDNAIVKLMLGTDEIASGRTNDIGEYSFTNVNNGVYNIVITTADGETKTKLLTVNNTGSTPQEIEVKVSSGKANSIVECNEETIEDTKLDIKKTVVDGLDEIAGEQTPSGNDKITIKLKVEPKNEQVVDSAEEIKQKAGNGKIVEFIDMGLIKLVNDEVIASFSDDNTKLLTIIIPFNFINIDVNSVMVLRKHGTGDAEILTKDPISGNEGYIVNTDAGTITIYAMKFSDYAIAYENADSNIPHNPKTRYKAPNTGVEVASINNHSLLKLSSLSIFVIGAYIAIKKKKDN